MGSPTKKAMLFVLLDRSGSMGGKEADVIGSINTFIEEQKKLPDPAVIAIANFSAEIPGMITFTRPMVSLAEIKPLTEDDYKPLGGTPLLDATGKAIQALDEDWKREKPDRCIFVTFTDGEENCSQEFTKQKIKNLIEAREKSGLWSFLFFGANVDSFLEASAMGYTVNKMSNYVASGVGTRNASATMSESVGTLRGMSAHGFACASAGNADIGLGKNIAEDGTQYGNVQDNASIGQGLADALTQQGKMPPPRGLPTGWGPDLSKTIVPPTVNQTPPAAAMAQPTWEPPTSSALKDPKITPWSPPQ